MSNCSLSFTFYCWHVILPLIIFLSLSNSTKNGRNHTRINGAFKGALLFETECDLKIIDFSTWKLLVASGNCIYFFHKSCVLSRISAYLEYVPNEKNHLPFN